MDACKASDIGVDFLTAGPRQNVELDLDLNCLTLTHSGKNFERFYLDTKNQSCKITQGAKRKEAIQ